MMGQKWDGATSERLIDATIRGGKAADSLAHSFCLRLLACLPCVISRDAGFYFAPAYFSFRRWRMDNPDS